MKKANSGENTTQLSILFRHGSLVIEVCQSVATNHQKPHDHDNCFIIIKGHGKFEMSDEIVSFSPGDFLFVLAGLPHRFTDFSDTMSTWVMFYGPDSGENSNSPKNRLDIFDFIAIGCVKPR
ncbi:cupin domain-containing protein [Candidatus Puniceispirillum sp.]|nr:cupin domain-containing protein [Candidatus Puniceispirillum sp.]